MFFLKVIKVFLKVLDGIIGYLVKKVVTSLY